MKRKKQVASLSAVMARCAVSLWIWVVVPVAEAHADVLSAIARCESRGQEYGAGGRVLRNKFNRAVVGVFQINERVHGALARRLGMDIYTVQGNWAYARYLLHTEGTAPWLASKECWQRLAKR